MRLLATLSLLALSGCGCLNPFTALSDCPAGTPGHHDYPYEAAVKNLPAGTCNDTREDWPGVPKCGANK